MKHARLGSHKVRLCTTGSRWFRLIGLAVSAAVILSGLAIVPVDTVVGKPQTNAQERRVTPLPPRPGPPAANLPNLDVVRSATERGRDSSPRVTAPRPIPSTMRSRRKPPSSPTPPPGRLVQHSSPRRTDRNALTNRNSLAALDNSQREKSNLNYSHHARRVSKAGTVSLAVPTMPQGQTINVAATANGGMSTAQHYSRRSFPWLALSAVLRD